MDSSSSITGSRNPIASTPMRERTGQQISVTPQLSEFEGSISTYSHEPVKDVTSAAKLNFDESQDSGCFSSNKSLIDD